ncbi:MAG: 2Fe-2S iron-sulfur cluster-binding protein [Limisphaerales bacterium]
MFEGYYRNDLKTGEDLDEQLAGNLCRCTGYRPIRDAAMDAFAERATKNGDDTFAERLQKSDANLARRITIFPAKNFCDPLRLRNYCKSSKPIPTRD